MLVVVDSVFIVGLAVDTGDTEYVDAFESADVTTGIECVFIVGPAVDTDDTEYVDAFESADVTTGIECVFIVELADVTVEFSTVDAAVVLATLGVFSVVTRVIRGFLVFAIGTKSTSKSKKKKIILHKESCASAHVLFNLLNESRKIDSFSQ